MQAGDTFENNASYASTNSGRADACLVGHVDDDVEVVDDDDHFADDTASRSSDESGWPRREKRPKAASTPSTVPWQSRRARIMQHKQSTKSFSVFKKKVQGNFAKSFSNFLSVPHYLISKSQCYTINIFNLFVNYYLMYTREIWHVFKF